ncbi:MAG: ATP-binding protein [Steroidobacteraceae bacterium]
MRWSTERKMQAGFACALACVALIAAVSFVSLRRLTDDAAGVRHAITVLGGLRRLESGIETAESEARDFLVTGSPADLSEFRGSVRLIERSYGALQRQTAGNALAQTRLAQLGPLLDARLAGLARLIQLRRTRGFRSAQLEDLQARLHRGTADQIIQIVTGLRTAERELLARREAAAGRRTLITEQTVAAGGAIAFIVVGFALFALRRDFAGRRRAEAALRQLNADLENRVVERTAALEQANASLHASERRLRAFIETTSDVVYEINPDWSELHARREADSGAVMPALRQDWLEQHIPPQDRQNVRAAIEQAIAGGTLFELEHRIRRVDGSIGWVVSRAVPLKDDSGRIVEWFGAASDVTDRKEAGMRLEAQLARLGLLSAITRAMGERQDVRSIFQVVIRTLETHLSLDFCSISTYEEAEKYITIARVGAQSEPLAPALAMSEGARIPIDQNGLSRCVSGELVYEPDLAAIPFPFARRLVAGGLGALVAAPLRFENQVFGVLLAARRATHSFSSGESEFLRQLSEHVALAARHADLYQALQRAYDDLRQTQQAVLQQGRLMALGTMASGIAHDINNAISPIMLYTDMLLEDRELSARVKGPLQVIQRAVEQVAHTVARMREFYRAREPQQALLPIDLNQLVAQVIDLTRARWSDMPQQRGVLIELQTELSPGLPPVPGVAAELRDALTNLVFNAVDAMPQGGVLSLRTRVLGSCSSAGASDRGVQLEVADTGLGMDAETRNRCLEPFFTTKGAQGTGLGLPMVYGTMQRHGGEIEVVSAPGEGTQVILTFSETLTAGGDATGAQPAAVVAPRKILLVDDDPIVIQSTRETLASDGHSVAVADGGKAGIAAFQAAVAAGQYYEVVITDLGMPQVDGRQVASAIKAARPDTLVLLLTGWGRRLVEEGEVPPHVDRVLTKPARLHDLRDALARGAERPQSGSTPRV